MEHARERVAIIGSGLAGLVSANLLFHDVRQSYAVRVFESVGTPYAHAHVHAYSLWGLH
jgi:predicted NAD/FAD-binding protein